MHKLVYMETTSHPDCVVSLTTWKKRIGSPVLPENLYRLLRQKTKYDYRVALVLSSEEFPRREAEVPNVLLAMAEKEPRFEIVWCKRNTRALKKLEGTRAVYPNLPIITTDDDLAVKECYVDEFMRAHREHPKDIIAADVWMHPCGFDITGWGRLYPPNSLALLPDELFMKYFKGMEDDVWNGLRAYLVGTKHRKLGSWPFIEERKIGDTALSGQYLKTDPVEMLRKFAKEWKGKV